MEAVLHIDPSDTPVAGKVSRIYFMSFLDSRGTFELADCRCTAVVLENGRRVASAQFSGASGDVLSFAHTFSHAGVYTIELSGESLAGGRFPSFKIAWNQRIERGGTSEKEEKRLILGCGITFILIGLLYWGYFRRRIQRIEKKV